jgi:uncharacterized protein (DUF362 family)
MAKVSIVKAESDFYAAFAKAVSEIDGQLISRGDCVLIKPNLVMPASPDSGEITSPEVIEAVARYCLDFSAARVIIVGDCASVEDADKYNWVQGCPPSKEIILSSLKRFMFMTKQEC